MRLLLVISMSYRQNTYIEAQNLLLFVSFRFVLAVERKLQSQQQQLILFYHTFSRFPLFNLYESTDGCFFRVPSEFSFSAVESLKLCISFAFASTARIPNISLFVFTIFQNKSEHVSFIHSVLLLMIARSAVEALLSDQITFG